MTLIVNDIKRVSSLFLFFERVLQGYDVIAEGKKKEKKGRGTSASGRHRRVAASKVTKNTGEQWPHKIEDVEKKK